MKQIFALTFALCSVSALASAHYRSAKLQDLKLPVSVEGCSLKRFSVTTYDLEYLMEFKTMPATRQTMMAAVTETTNSSCIKDYGVVQFIRGCIYIDRINNSTNVSSDKYLHNRELRGQSVEFKHADWVVDSVDLDPLYNSYDKEDANALNRHDWHRFVKVPLLLQEDEASLMKDTPKYFNSKNFGYVMNAEAPLSQIYVSDLPSGSSLVPNAGANHREVITSSLEFKTCIYNIRDIPVMGDPAKFDAPEDQGGPIKCFEWSDKAKFNKKNQTFDRVNEMDPFCL